MCTICPSLVCMFILVLYEQTFKQTANSVVVVLGLHLQILLTNLICLIIIKKFFNSILIQASILKKQTYENFTSGNNKIN